MHLSKHHLGITVGLRLGYAPSLRRGGVNNGNGISAYRSTEQVEAYKEAFIFLSHNDFLPFL
jgi:hypothetical protein